MISQVDSAWLEYQIMCERLHLEKCSAIQRAVLRAAFEDGFSYGKRYEARDQKGLSQ